MKEENKISIQEVHQQLNFYAGRKIPVKDLEVLLECWRKKMGYQTNGREGGLDAEDVPKFLRYAW